ncbi:NFACT RNA binding domain-containing protein [Parvimonas sp. D2]|uniref:Rqc2 family fibronectin-binding protein n=1 Tax=unclassified Parvimonas TaxID=1151464 RepID=UPI002B48C978|nr:MULTISPECIES: NFACT RNA binding domain-containing protein [unclassified Parvimonas]MEB3011860.1 NFACT RNA binding domain-containing protein [Parvimonas sp. D2]MEB3087352.1 NFACT RNA binding domain-containing protein [Parvimonas sp. D4]
MSFDGIFTKAVVDEIYPLLLNGKINKINQPDKNEINLQIYNKENYKLLLSCANNLSRIHLSEKSKKNPITAYNFCMLLRKHLVGGTIKNIYQHKMDRVVCFEIENLNELKELSKKLLIIEIMGKHSNIILVDKESNKIIDAIKHIDSRQSSIREVFPNKDYFFVKDEKENILDENYKLPSEILKNSEPISMKKFFYTNYLGFSPIISYELLNNSNVDSAVNSANLNDEDIKRIDENFVKIVENIKDKNYYPIFIKDEMNNNKDFYCFDLNLYEKKESVDSLSKLVESFYHNNSLRDRINQKASGFKKILNTKLNRLTNKYLAMNDELLNNQSKEDFKIFADLLSINIYKIEKGMKKVSVENIYDNMKEVEISLDERKSPRENIEAYYKKYKKLKTADEIIKAELQKIEEEMKYIKQILETIEIITELNELSEIEEELISLGYIRKSKKNKQKLEKSKPYIFETDSGALIYVGKNNLQNENLTLKFANKNDIFFHAQDVPGSHVILRGTNLTEDDYKIAGFLAGYYSYFKNEGYANVDYTEKKHIRKAKGTGLGMVYYDNYKTLFIDFKDKLYHKYKK